MFDDDDRRLVQVASIANAVAAASNGSPWRALVWLAEQVEAGALPARMFIPVRMRTVDTTRTSPSESKRVWRSMAKRAEADRKKDMLNYHLPATASTWFVHVNVVAADRRLRAPRKRWSLPRAVEAFGTGEIPGNQVLSGTALSELLAGGLGDCDINASALHPRA